MRILIGLLALLLVTPSWSEITLRDCNGGDVYQTDEITVTKPAGTVDDDGMTAFYNHADNTASDVTLTGGWAEYEDFEDGTGGGVTTAGYTKIASSEGADYDFTGSEPSPDDHSVAIICSWAGTHATTLLDVTYVRANHYIRELNDSSPTAQPITTNTDGAIVVIMSTVKLGNVSDMVCPSGFAEAFEVDGGSSRKINVCWKVQATKGVVTPGSSNHVDMAETDDTSFHTLALAPAAAASAASVILLRRRH